MITDPDRPVSLDPNALQTLFSLTPAEAKVTSLLVQGRSMEQIAAWLAVSLETVRTHIRRVFSKTATTRQGELIALVLRTVPSVPESANAFQQNGHRTQARGNTPLVRRRAPP
jgi:DNA-binding CsgD family transcriptional regulator